MVCVFGSDPLEPAEPRPELVQGLKVYAFLRDHLEVPLYFQPRLTEDEAIAVSDSKTGKPRYLIGPYPFTYKRQRALLRAYAHYLEDRDNPDPERVNITVKKAKKNPNVKKRLDKLNAAADKVVESIAQHHGWEFSDGT